MTVNAIQTAARNSTIRLYRGKRQGNEATAAGGPRRGYESLKSWSHFAENYPASLPPRGLLHLQARSFNPYNVGSRRDFTARARADLSWST